MEFLTQTLAKAVAYQTYVLLGWMVFVTILLLWMFLRQRRSKKLLRLVSANFENVRAKIDEMSAQSRRHITESLGALGKQIQEGGAAQKKAVQAAAAAAQGVDELGRKLTDQLFDVQQAVTTAATSAAASAAGGAPSIDPRALADIVARLDSLADEIAWTHHYYEELKVLEAAVRKLVGPDKLAKLVEKEKTGRGGASGDEILRKAQD